MVDCIILKNIIQTRWKTFRIFGIEFTDTTLISKLFGTIIVILVSSKLGTVLRWW
jgi:hypothetical protein